MTREEFSQVTAYIAVACGKDLTDEGLEVYFDLLGDLPADVFQLAAKRVLLEHRWATFPTVAELRQAAVESARGQVKELAPAEAWAIAWWVAGNTDPELVGSFERACAKAKAPPLVIEAVQKFGLLDLCYGKEPVGVLRGQFLDTFEQLQARDRRKALMPAAVRDAIEDNRPAVAAPRREPAALVGRLAEAFNTPGV